MYLNSGNDSIEDIGSGYDDDYGDYAYDTENGDDDVATTEEASYEDYFPTYDESKSNKPCYLSSEIYIIGTKSLTE